MGPLPESPYPLACPACAERAEYITQLEESLLQLAYEKQQLMDLLKSTVDQVALLRQSMDALVQGQGELVAVLVESEHLDVPDLRHQQLD